MEKELWFTNKGSVEIKPVKLPITNDLVYVKSLFSLISSGTEKLAYLGEIPKSLHATMKVPYMKGEFSFPFTYGYSLVGEVVQPGHKYNGRIVHLLHPHQTYAQVEEQSISLIPKGVDPKLAVLASNLETALNAVWDGGIKIGENVLIVGFGTIGALLGGVLRSMKHVKVYVLENDERRISLAKKLGFTIFDSTISVDATFNTSANEEGFQKGLNAVGFEGRLIELSWYGNKEISVNFGGDFHSQRKKIISSQVSSLPVSMRSTWDYERRKQVVYELLQDEYFSKLPLEKILFDNVSKAYDDLKLNNITGIAKIIEYV